MRQLVQQRLAFFAGGMRGQNFAPQRAKFSEPCAQIGGQLRVDFTAQALCNGRAFAGS